MTTDPKCHCGLALEAHSADEGTCFYTCPVHGENWGLIDIEYNVEIYTCSKCDFAGYWWKGSFTWAGDLSSDPTTAVPICGACR